MRRNACDDELRLGVELVRVHLGIVAILNSTKPETLEAAANVAEQRASVFVKPYGRKAVKELFVDGEALRQALCYGAPELEVSSDVTQLDFVNAGLELAWHIDPTGAESIALEAARPGSSIGLRRLAIRSLAHSCSDLAVDFLVSSLHNPQLCDQAAAALIASPNQHVCEGVLAVWPPKAMLPDAGPDDELVTVVLAIVGVLGARKCREAVAAVLFPLWRSSPMNRIRAAAAQALLVSGGQDDLRALATALDDEDRGVAEIAIRAVFTLDPASAFAVFAPHFTTENLTLPRSERIAKGILHVLTEDARRARHPELPGATSHGLVWQDGRWTDLVLEMLDHDSLGWNALQLAPYLLDTRVLPAILSRLGKDETEDICEALWTLGDAAAVPRLREALVSTKKKADRRKLEKLIMGLTASPKR